MSSKIEMLRSQRGNVVESMGGGMTVTPASVGTGAGGPEHLRGLTRQSNVAKVPLGKLAPDPEQPREEFDPGELDRLADSLKSHGQIQPIAAWWDAADSVYRIAAGERRWRAARIAGLEALTVTILPARPEDGRLKILQLAENIHRDGLKPMEQARAFRAIMDLNAWSASRFAREMSLTEATVSRMLSLLDLPGEVRSKVESGSIAGATAYVISQVADPTVQLQVAERVVSEGLSRDETIEAIRRVTPGKATAARGRGAGKSRKPFVKTLRLPQGKLTIELRKGQDHEAIVAFVRQALELLEVQEAAA